MATTFATKPATLSQRSFIQSLLNSRQAPLALTAQFTEDLTSANASRLIDKLKKCPWKNTGSQATTVKKATEIVPEGFYCVGDNVYKVQTSKTSGAKYAKVWTGGHSKWAYAPGIVKTLTLADKLTEAQAAKFGQKTGHCCICSKLLTDPKSVEAGIGPVCSAKMGW